MITLIVGSHGCIEKYIYVKNSEIFSELLKIGKTENKAREFLNNLQSVRMKHEFFSENFKRNFEKKLSFFASSLKLLQDNDLPLNTGGIRDQFILQFLRPFFLYQRKQRKQSRNNEARLPLLSIDCNEVLDIMELYKIPRWFIKELFDLHDSDMDGGFYEWLFLKTQHQKPLPRFITS